MNKNEITDLTDQLWKWTVQMQWRFNLVELTDSRGEQGNNRLVSWKETFYVCNLIFNYWFSIYSATVDVLRIISSIHFGASRWKPGNFHKRSIVNNKLLFLRETNCTLQYCNTGLEIGYRAHVSQGVRPYIVKRYCR